MAHSIDIKVYYEDTDAGGVVYYANYLRFLERARTEYLLEKNIDVIEYHKQGYFFVVVRVDIQYKKSGVLGDILTVTTEPTEIRAVAMTLKNKIFRGDTLLVEADVTIACINKNHKPCRLPEKFKTLKLGYHAI
jgi:acyl-CoA thioester hydrolase